MNLNKITNQLPLPLKFVYDLSLQAHKSCSCESSCVFPILSPDDRFPTMILRKPTGVVVLTSVELYTEDDVLAMTMSPSLFTTWIPDTLVSPAIQVKYFIYNNVAHGLAIGCGKYYIKLTFDTGGFITHNYTELFEVKPTCCLSRIEWSNATDEDYIPYKSKNVKGILYLLTETDITYKEVISTKQNDAGEIYIENSRIEEWVEVNMCQAYCNVLHSLFAINTKTYKRFFYAKTSEIADIIDLDIQGEPNDSNNCLCYVTIKFRQSEVAKLAPCANSIPSTLAGHDNLTPIYAPLCETCLSPMGISVSYVTNLPDPITGLIDVVVTWLPVEGADSYFVSATGIGTQEVTETTITLEGLEECTEYTICVVSKCSDGFSEPECIEIETPNRICYPLFNVVGTVLNQTTIDLSWTAPLYGVIIEWKEISEPWSNLLGSGTAAAMSTSYQIIGLEECTSYAIRVGLDCESFNCPQDTIWVSLPMLTTLCCELAINIENNGDIDCDNNTTEITISAVDFSGNPYVGSYDINIYDAYHTVLLGSITDAPLVITLGQGSYSIDYISNDYGCSFNQMIVLDGTCDCVAPTALTSTHISSNTSQTNWEDIPNATSYNIRYRDINTSTWIYVTGIPVSAYSIAGLTPCTTYEFMVQSVCQDELSPWSLLSVFTTDGCNNTGDECNNVPSMSITCEEFVGPNMCLSFTDDGSYSTIGTKTIEFSIDGSNWSTNPSDRFCATCGQEFYARLVFTSDECPIVSVIYRVFNVYSCECYSYTNLITGVTTNVGVDCVNNCCEDTITVNTYCDCELKRCFVASPDSDTTPMGFVDGYGDYTIELYEFTIDGVPVIASPEIRSITSLGDLNYEHMACGFDYYPIVLQLLIDDMSATVPNFKVHYWDTCDDNLYASPFRIECCQEQHVVFKWKIYAGLDLFWDCVFDSNVGTTFNGAISNVPLNCYNADPITNIFQVENHANISMAFNVENQCTLCLRWDGIPLQMGEPYLCEVSLNGSPLSTAVFTTNHMIKYEIPVDLPAGINTWIAKLTYTPNGATSPTVIIKNITFNNVGACDNGLITIF